MLSPGNRNKKQAVLQFHGHWYPVARALATAQHEWDPPSRTKEAQATATRSYMYAPLEEYFGVSIPELSKYGVATLQAHTFLNLSLIHI